MLRYVCRRWVQMIPTLFGVILLTFILFHVVGGSPAALTLGEHVSAQTLEEFDEQRGFNRPLFFGAWTRTRAVEDYRSDPPGARIPLRPADSRTDGVDLVGSLPPGLYALDPLFPLPPAPRYRIRIRLELPPGTRAEWMSPAAEETSGSDAAHTAVDPVRLLQNPIGRRGRRPSRLRITPHRANREGPRPRGPFPSGVLQEPPVSSQRIVSGVERTFVFTPETGLPLLRIDGPGARLERFALRRGMAHRWDSQLFRYIAQLARLDLGYSSIENRRVSSILKEGIGPSLALTTPILLGGIGLALFLSLWCAAFQGRWPDRLLVVAAVVLMSVNYVVWIVLGQYVLGFRWGWFPVWGFESWRYLLLPVTIGLISGLGSDLRFYRTVMVEEMRREYVQTARAKGVGRSRLLWSHVLPNALVPVLAQTATALPFLYTGSLLLESFFGIPGLGYVGVNAVNSADIDVLRAVVLVGAVLFMGINLVTDIAYAAVDPRVKLQ